MINIRTSTFTGSTVRLSTSRSRNCPGSRSLVGVMYESNSISVKSEYSYLQYHWCPTAFTVTPGATTSSMRYRRRSEGRARKRRTPAGKIVQIVSTSCASAMWRQERVFIMRAIRAYATNVITMIMTSNAWS